MAKITMREAISQALSEEMDRDPAVFILGEEVGVWGGTYAVTKGFFDKYGPDRIKDTPIAENAIIGAAIGAAMVGQRPIEELMTINFAFSAMDYAGRDPFADAGRDLRPFPRAQSRLTGHAGRCKGIAEDIHPIG
jgi:pyruvate/2-oxoglutarate/acetoin dehydrogenase E1 component